MNVGWPAEWVDLTTASALFKDVGGRDVSRSSLSRYVSKRNFPTRMAGRAVLVDAKALFDAFTTDYTRQVMAGELQFEGAAVANSAAPNPAGGFPALVAAGGPNFPAAQPQLTSARQRGDELKAEVLALDLAERKRDLIPTAEVIATMTDAVAEMQSALTLAAGDVAERLLEQLGLPSTRLQTIKAAMKDMIRLGRETFASTMARRRDEDGPVIDVTPSHLDQLVALAIELRSGEPPMAPVGQDGPTPNAPAAAEAALQD